MNQTTDPQHRSILCVDVEDFGDPRRTDQDQAIVRAALYQAVEEALFTSQVPWERCHHEDRGDGLLVLIRPEVPKSHLVTIFPGALAAALERHNQAHGAPARIRLRVALHAGEIRHDKHGVVSRSIILAYRLLDAAAVKEALGGSAGVLALVASDWFFDHVIRHEPAAAPDAYEKVRIAVKETRTEAWVCLPDQIGADSARRTRLVRKHVASVPRQILAPVGNFVGREDELKALTRLLDEADGRREALMIAVITGPAGVGKTALATQWAHHERGRFPDGELHINLRGADPESPISAGKALEVMLRALDVDAEKIPDGIEAKAALYRSVLDGRRMLVMLDNAADGEQVRPLVPGTPGCVVIVTSRSRLSGFTVRVGAHLIGLDRLSEADAVTLLRQIIGLRQVDAEPAAAAEIASRCDYLPLALRVAAVRAATRPHSRLADIAHELSGEHERLDILNTEDRFTGIRTVFSWSYGALPAPAARTFRLLALHRGPDISLEVVAALIDTSPPAARESLDQLTGKHLVEETGRDRFRLHDLLRCYAMERAHEEETEEDQSDAVRRMLVWYLRAAAEARGSLIPDHFNVALAVVDWPAKKAVFTNRGEAQRWYETERLNLIAAIPHAAATGHHDIAWRLTFALNAFFYLHKYSADWTATHEIGLASARHLRDRVGEACVLMGLGFAFQDHDFERSIANYRQALDIFRKVADRAGQGWSVLGIGHVSRGLRRFKESIGCYEEALIIFRETGSRLGQSLAHLGIGYASGGLRRFQRSVDCFQKAFEYADDDRPTQGWALHGLGYGYRGLRRFEESIEHYERALRVFQEIGDWRGQGNALANLAKAQADAGRHDEARRSRSQAMAIFRDLHIDRDI